MTLIKRHRQCLYMISTFFSAVSERLCSKRLMNVVLPFRAAFQYKFCVVILKACIELVHCYGPIFPPCLKGKFKKKVKL